MIADRKDRVEVDRKKVFYANPDVKPTILATDPDGIPAVLKANARWVLWKLVWNPAKGAWDKVPVNPWSRRNAKANDPATWGTFEVALAALASDPECAGLGYQFEKGAGEIGIDLDGCCNPDTGVVAQWAQDIIDLFGTYCEVSPSGTGVKMIAYGTLPYTRKLNDREVYDAGRFFTVTGRPVPGTATEVRHCQATIDEHFTRLFPPKTKTPAPHKPERTTTTAEVEPDDDKLLDQIRASKQGDKFSALYDRGDTSGHQSDDSRADLALCCVLAWWTQKNADRVDQLFRHSKLFRDKWNEPRGEGRTYGSMTVDEALRLTSGEYDPRHEANKIIWGFAQDLSSGATHGEPASDSHDGPGAKAEREDEACRSRDGDGAPDDDEPDDETAPPKDRKPDEEKKGKPAPATRLVELVHEAGVGLFHTPDKEAYARIPRDGHVEVHAVKGTQFRRFLSQIFFKSEGRAANGEATATAIGTLEAIATFECAEHPVHRRVAPGPDGALVLDLCDDRWRAVVIRPGGWEVTNDPPVMFARSNTMRSLPEPKLGGRLSDLRPFLNLKSEDDWLLATAWLAAALRPTGPYPVLHPKGEQGTAKTTFGRMLRRLFDPNKVDLRSQPREERDLAVSSLHGWALCYDNLSDVPRWLSDALCRVATGGGFGTRALYTDDEEKTFDFMRPVLLTSIEDVIGQPDLLDRSLALELLPIPDDRRKTEEELWAEYDAAHPGILAGLLDVIARALELLPGIVAEKRPVPRMADFALFGEAVARAQGAAPGRFLTILAGIRSNADQDALQGSTLALILYEWIKKCGVFVGTSTALLRELNGSADFCGRPPKDWPVNAQALSGQVRKISPALRRLGVDVRHTKEGHERARTVTIRYEPAKASGTSSASSASSASKGNIFSNED